jgi:hypothetical protein
MGQNVQVFVVQVWPAEPHFRALARPAEAKQAQDFDDPMALLDYLRLGPTGAAVPTPPHPEPELP